MYKKKTSIFHFLFLIIGGCCITNSLHAQPDTLHTLSPAVQPELFNELLSTASDSISNNHSDAIRNSSSTDDTLKVVIEGILLVHENGEPPVDTSLKVYLDSVELQVSPSGEFSRSVERRNYYMVEVYSGSFLPVRKTVTRIPDKNNYFLTIILERRSDVIIDTVSSAVDTAEIPWIISGTVIDSRFDLAIRSDSISLLFDNNTIPVSNKGNFTIITHLSGVHTIFVSIPGYQQVTETITCSDNDKQPYIAIPTTIIGRTITRRELTVTASNLPIHRSSSVARVDISQKELLRATTNLNDPVRMLHTLPGVTSESDIASRPVIRGGDVLESRAFLDGVSLIQPYHFGGVRSTFNQAALKGLTLYKSGFPAEYHNAQSGIIDAQSRIPSDEKPSFNTDINLLQYDAYLGIPLFKGKAGINLSSQGSYFDPIAKLEFKLIGAITDNNETKELSQQITLPDYRDFSGGIAINPSPKLKIFINEIINTDKTQFVQSDSAYDVTYHYNDTSVTMQRQYWTNRDNSYDPDEQPLEGRQHDGNPSYGKPYLNIDTLLDYRSRYNILYGNVQFTPSDNQTFTLTTAWQKRWWDLNFPDISDMFDTTIYDINLNQYNVNLGWVYSGFVNHTIKSGLQLDYTTADYNVYIVRFLHEFIMKGSTNQTDFWGPLNGDTAATFNSSNDYFFFELTDRILVKYKGARKYYNAGFYLHDSWDIIPRLHLDIGARAEYSRSDHTTTFSPRFALNFNATKNNELILSAGHYTQNNYDISAIALSDDLKPEKVWHGSIGCESRLLPWLNQKIDFYGKYYYDLLSEIIVPVKDRENLNNPEPTSFPDGSNNDITEYLSPFYATYRSKYINDGKGYAFGTEYMLRFYPFDFWHGWISLSLGKSVRQRKEGWRKHPFPLDRPILISVHNYYRLPKQYEIGLKYRFMSGLPYTSVEEKDDQIEIGAFNNRRYAPYHRFDLRFSRGFSIKDAKGHFYIEIWNSMNAPNLFSLDNKSKEMITLSTNLPSTILFIGFDCSF